MTHHNINFEQIEQRVYHLWFEDGLQDIFAGIYIVLTGLMILDDGLLVMWIIWPVLMIGIRDTFKQRFIYPRTGFMKLDMQQSQEKKLTLPLIGGVLFLFGVMMLIGIISGQSLDKFWWIMLASGGWIGIVGLFGLWAHVHTAKRWYAYAVLFGLSGLGMIFDKPLLPIATGMIMMITGIMIFVSFLHHNPILTGEIFNESE